MKFGKEPIQTSEMFKQPPRFESSKAQTLVQSPDKQISLSDAQHFLDAERKNMTMHHGRFDRSIKLAQIQNLLPAIDDKTLDVVFDLLVKMKKPDDDEQSKPKKRVPIGADKLLAVSRTMRNPGASDAPAKDVSRI